MDDFKGFPRDFFRFFRELTANNERPWFEANKDRYRESVVAPMMGFIEAMAPRLEQISPHYRAIAKPHGGSMFRIYRDTRFSKDKTPYKTHAGCHFRHELGKDAHAPGFYAHFENGGLFFGGGIWRPPSKPLGLIRHFIADNPAAWRRIVQDRQVLDRGGLQGDQLKRPPRGFDPEHEHLEDLKRKSFYVMTRAKQSVAYSPALLDAVTEAFAATRSLGHFICDALEVPF